MPTGSLGYAVAKISKIPLFAKESPRRGEPLDRFQKFFDLSKTTTLHLCFKFDVIRFTNYGVIAEKPRVSQLGQNFPCTL